MEIKRANIPDPLNNPQVKFVKNDFDQLIWDKGYNVYWDKAVRCPCKIHSGDNLSSCLNCGSSGWFFINRTETKMLLQGMNFSTQFKDWSEVNIGTVKISTRDQERISFMDRIILIDAETVFSEVVYPILSETNVLFIRPFYEIKQLEEIFAFDSDKSKLNKLIENDDYVFSEGKIIFNSDKYLEIENFRVTLRYITRPSFNVIDLTRDIANFQVYNNKGQLENLNFPSSGVGRRSHYIFDVNNFTGNLLFDNSYSDIVYYGGGLGINNI